MATSDQSVMMVTIQLRRVLVHHLVRILHCGIVCWAFVLCLPVGRTAEQVFDGTCACRSLIYSKGCSKLTMSADLYRIQHIDCEVLAIVAD